MLDPRLHRIDSTRVRIDNPHGVEATLFANADVPVETASLLDDAPHNFLWREEIDGEQEAPYAYKGIGPVVETLTAAGLASPVAELTPLMTIKG